MCSPFQLLRSETVARAGDHLFAPHAISIRSAVADTVMLLLLSEKQCHTTQVGKSTKKNNQIEII